MRKDTTAAKLTEYEKERNKKISKKRYIAAPCGIKACCMDYDIARLFRKLRKIDYIKRG